MCWLKYLYWLFKVVYHFPPFFVHPVFLLLLQIFQCTVVHHEKAMRKPMCHWFLGGSFFLLFWIVFRIPIINVLGVLVTVC